MRLCGVQTSFVTLDERNNTIGCSNRSGTRSAAEHTAGSNPNSGLSMGELLPAQENRARLAKYDFDDLPPARKAAASGEIDDRDGNVEVIPLAGLPAPGYRADIDGLRAVAVIGVMICNRWSASNSLPTASQPSPTSTTSQSPTASPPPLGRPYEARVA